MTIYLWILLEWEIFLDKICRQNWNSSSVSITFFPWKSCRLWDNVEKFSTAGEATDDDIKRRMRVSHRIAKATYAHSECVILLPFWRQQWFRERVPMLLLLLLLLLLYLSLLPCSVGSFVHFLKAILPRASLNSFSFSAGRIYHTVLSSLPWSSFTSFFFSLLTYIACFGFL